VREPDVKGSMRSGDLGSIEGEEARVELVMAFGDEKGCVDRRRIACVIVG